ncbi:choice-of-anchor K domain-containing protein [Nocardia sp. NPDC050630]|uniref:choice-of-anchor K domain-containing protein n=1 Tax=Nocardia sp. NPDC050630 TaxID=3364321 RepID=UPI00379D56BC
MGGNVETDTKRGGHCPPDIYTLPTGSPRRGQIVGLTDVDARLDGKDFNLGIFAHYNNRVTLKHNQFSVFLKVTVDFQDEGFDRTFTLRFRHNETPNQPGDVDDVIKLPIVHEDDIVRVDGAGYQVTISGFRDHGGWGRCSRSSPTPRVRSRECGLLPGSSRSASRVPEPRHRTSPLRVEPSWSRRGRSTTSVNNRWGA